MMKHYITFAVLALVLKVQALVAPTDILSSEQNKLSIAQQTETGKIEPNENKSSFQDADIKKNIFKYSRGFYDWSFLKNPTLQVEYVQFESKQEKIGNQVFYEKDSGNYVGLSLAAELVHTNDRIFGFYIDFKPSANYNKNKFSNPRVDPVSFGLNSALNLTENLFQKNLIHFGSGVRGAQNAYFAIDTGFGYRLSYLTHFPIVLSTSLFIEADTEDRSDAIYDAAFSADRVRAFKYGTLLGLELEPIEDITLSVTYLQKLGGYDARSTQIATLGLGLKF